MKKTRSFALLLALALLLAACGSRGAGPAAPGASTVLNLYAWSEYVPQALLEGFSAKTGIKVHYDAYSSNEELLAKLQAGASGYDLIIPSDYTIEILVRQGMLEPLDLAQIPNYANLSPEMKDLAFDPGNRYSIPYQWGTLGLAVDTSKVDRPITRWADLWDPAFKDRVLLLDDSRETIGMVLMSLGYDRNTTDPAQLEQARDRLVELLPNVRLFDSDSPKTALLSGEVWLAEIWNGEANIAHSENPAIQYIFPEEGVGIFFDNLAIPAGAPHPDAAHAFLNYVLEPEASLLITAEFPYSSPNRAALDLLKTKDPAAYEAYMSFPGTNPPAEIVKKAQMIKDVGDATSLWDRAWTEVKEGK